MSLAQVNNTPTRPRIEPGSLDPESNALTTRPVRSPPAFGEITTACNVDRAKKGHGACLNRTTILCCKENNFISRLNVNFLDLTQNIDKVSGALNEGQGHRVKVPASRVCQGQ